MKIIHKSAFSFAGLYIFSGLESPAWRGILLTEIFLINFYKLASLC